MLNLEEIESQIDQTEDYLRVSNQDLTNINRRSIRKSYEADSNDENQGNQPEQLRNSTVSVENKYTDPQERELLVQKLLSDYTTRKERGKPNYFDIPDDEFKPSTAQKETSSNESQMNSTIRFSSKDITARMAEINESRDSIYSAETIPSNEDESFHSKQEQDDNLFYASDLQSSTDPETWKKTVFKEMSKDSLNPATTDLAATQRNLRSLNPSEKFDLLFQEDAEIMPPDIRKGRNHFYSLENNRSSSKDRENKSVESKRETRASSRGRAATRYSSSSDREKSRSQSAERVFQLSKEKLREQAEKEFREKHPFKPNLRPATTSRSKSTSPPPRSSSAAPSTAVKSSSSAHLFQPSQHIHRSHFFDRLEEMNRRHQLKQKEKEKLRNELENLELMQCTFQPEITQKARKILSVKDLNRKIHQSYDDYIEEEEEKDRRNLHELSNRLHEEARQKRKKMHYLAQHMEEIELADCTFQPQINSLSNHLAVKHQQQSQRAAASSSPSSKAVRSSSSASLSPSKRHLVKNLHGNNNNNNNDPTADMNNSGRGTSYIPIHERLSDIQKEKQQHIRKLRQSLEQEQSAQITFRPEINSVSNKLAEKKLVKEGYSYPLHLRSDRRSLSPAAAGAGVSDDHEELLYLTKSNVAERLINEGRKLARRKQELLFDQEQEISQAAERPVMSDGSKKLIQKNSIFKKEDFIGRQRYYRSKSAQEQDRIIQQEHAKYESFFHPNIHQSKSLKIMKQIKPEIFMESPEETFHRLSAQDYELLQQKKKLLEQKYYNPYSLPFQPEINYVSKLFGRKSSQEILYENQETKNHLFVLKEKYEQQVHEECTFQPKINEYSNKLIQNKSELQASDYEKYYYQYYSARGYREGSGDGEEGGAGQGEDEIKGHRSLSPSFSPGPLGRINFQQPERMLHEIKLANQQKEKKRREELISREIEELQNCTFQPTLNQSFAAAASHSNASTSAKSSDPIVIKGLNRHLELRQLSEKLKKEEKEREFNAFHVRDVDKFRRQEDGATIVKSFDLRVNSPSRLDKWKRYSNIHE